MFHNFTISLYDISGVIKTEREREKEREREREYCLLVLFIVIFMLVRGFFTGERTMSRRVYTILQCTQLMEFCAGDEVFLMHAFGKEKNLTIHCELLN